MSLDSALVEDLHKDNPAVRRLHRLRITDWWFFKDTAVLKYIGLENATIKLATDRFHLEISIPRRLFRCEPPKDPSKKDTSKGLSLDLKEGDLSHIHFLKKKIAGEERIWTFTWARCS